MGKYVFSNCNKNMNTLLYYYNYNLGSVRFDNGKMLFFCPGYKGVPHGIMSVFDDEGSIVEKNNVFLWKYS